MSVNNNEQANIAIESPRDWLQLYRIEIDRALSDSLDKEQKLLQSLREQYGDRPGLRPFQTTEDIYSNPFCDILKQFDGRELNGALVKQVGVRIKVDGQKDRVINTHYIFRLNEYVVDPTFGQFVDLDKAISEHPELFINRILVATSEQVLDNFGVQYTGG